MHSSIRSFAALGSPFGSLTPAEGFVTPHPPQPAGLLRGTSRYSGVAQREIGAGWAGDSVTELRCRRRRRREGCRMVAPQLDGPPEPQKKREQRGTAAVHRVIFMRHGECEWNRYATRSVGCIFGLTRRVVRDGGILIAARTSCMFANTAALFRLWLEGLRCC